MYDMFNIVSFWDLTARIVRAARSVHVLWAVTVHPLLTSSCGQGAACSDSMELQLYLWSALVLWHSLPCTLIGFECTSIFSGSKLQNSSLILMQCIFRIFSFPGVQFHRKTYLTDAPTSQLWFITIINSKILQQKRVVEKCNPAASVMWFCSFLQIPKYFKNNITGRTGSSAHGEGFLMLPVRRFWFRIFQSFAKLNVFRLNLFLSKVNAQCFSSSFIYFFFFL